MHSGSDVTTMLLKFCSVWHGVCIYWNENIHSVEPCVTHVPHPSLLSSPSPAPTGGAPSNTGAQLRMGIFTPKTEKRRGLYKKNKKTQGGCTLLEGGLPGNLRNGKNAGGGALKKGKTQEGGTLLEGGLWGKF